MSFGQWVLAVVFWLVQAMTAYLGVLTVAAFRFRPRVASVGALPPMGVVIPAHDEEAGVADTVRSVLASAYGGGRLEVLVVADNCTDATAERAREAGARVFARADPANPGKGQALDWLLRRHAEQLSGFGILAVVDADTRVDPGFCAAVAASLAHPDVRVVQGYYGTANPRDSWRSALTEAALCVFHHLRPAGREALGGTVGLKGNGMAFAAQELLSRGWPAFSKVEDLEFTLGLLGDGVLVHYNPQAVVLGEMAVRGDQAAPQRRRWEGGRFALLARRGPGLLRAALGGGWAALDAFMDLAVPPLGLLAALQALLLAGCAAWLPGLVPWGVAGTAVLAAYVCCGLVLRRAPFVVWASLLAAPVYVAWKLVLYAGMLVTRQKGWVRTRRKTEL